MQNDNVIKLPEIPQNGIKGLKHWRQDMFAALMVSLISLPFSLAIAIASGVPPIAGLYSAIIAGLLLPFLGGSYLTISGPALGLSLAVLSSITILGKGDMFLGYTLTLASIFCAGLVQVILAWRRLGRFGGIMPAAATRGMLVGIGATAITTQIPVLIGVKFEGRGFWPTLGELITDKLWHPEPKVFMVGITTLVLIFGLSAFFKKRAESGKLGKVPPQMLAVVISTVFGGTLGWLVGLEPVFLIKLPENFTGGYTAPNFTGVLERLSNHKFMIDFAVSVFLFVLIDSVESLSTVSSVDQDDPYHRRSNHNRTLLAMGILNMCSSLIGGLTIIPGAVKSKANVEAGGRTQWANFYNACLLAMYVVFAAALISHLPLAALGAIVCFIGWKLCAKKVWEKFLEIGFEQLLILGMTALVTVTFGILWGIGVGVLIKLAVVLYYSIEGVEHFCPDKGVRKDLTRSERIKKSFGEFPNIFKNPMVKVEMDGDAAHAYFDGPMTCFSLVGHKIEEIPRSARSVHFHFLQVPIIDHTTRALMYHFEEQCNARHVTIVWHDRDERFRSLSDHPGAMLVHVPRRQRVRREDMSNEFPRAAQAD